MMENRDFKAEYQYHQFLAGEEYYYYQDLAKDAHHGFITETIHDIFRKPEDLEDIIEALTDVVFYEIEDLYQTCYTPAIVSTLVNIDPLKQNISKKSEDNIAQLFHIVADRFAIIHASDAEYSGLRHRARSYEQEQYNLARLPQDEEGKVQKPKESQNHPNPYMNARLNLPHVTDGKRPIKEMAHYLMQHHKKIQKNQDYLREDKITKKSYTRLALKVAKYASNAIQREGIKNPLLIDAMMKLYEGAHNAPKSVKKKMAVHTLFAMSHNVDCKKFHKVKCDIHKSEDISALKKFKEIAKAYRFQKSHGDEVIMQNLLDEIGIKIQTFNKVSPSMHKTRSA